jgi:hypothetical protein
MTTEKELKGDHECFNYYRKIGRELHCDMCGRVTAIEKNPVKDLLDNIDDRIDLSEGDRYETMD